MCTRGAETAAEVPGLLPELVHLQLFPDVQGPAGAGMLCLLSRLYCHFLSLVKRRRHFVRSTLDIDERQVKLRQFSHNNCGLCLKVDGFKRLPFAVLHSFAVQRCNKA